MITTQEALNIILNKSKNIGIEQIDLSFSLDRVLAENIHSDVNVPAFNRSAMDGFAINSKDTSSKFQVIEDVPAGKIPQKKIKFGQCARIMTGAMLPKGADKVVKVEDTLQLAANSMQLTVFDRKSNVSLKGEDVKCGKLVIKKGAVIRPQEAAVLATVGKTKIKVFKKPTVAVISTGSELVEPSLKPRLGQIRNSNGPMAIVQLKRLGIEGNYLGIAKDNFETTKKLVKKGLNTSDLLILSGGVSVGDYDFVYEVLKSCGVKILFNKVAIKPGKPTTFGIKGKKLIFGLPGNPVSAMLIFELFVVPAINKIENKNYKLNFSKCN